MNEITREDRAKALHWKEEEGRHLALVSGIGGEFQDVSIVVEREQVGWWNARCIVHGVNSVSLGKCDNLESAKRLGERHALNSH